MCPICKKQYIPEQATAPEKKPGRRKRIILIASASVIVAAAVLFLIFRPRSGPDVSPSPPPPAAGSSGDEGADGAISEAASTYAARNLDIDAYYEENATVVNRIDAAGSSAVHTEPEAVSGLNRRGFSRFPVSSDYTMSGAYAPSEDVSAGTGAKHPVYTTYYITAAGDLWTIDETNGCVTAYPVTYNMNSGKPVQVIFSETETIMSYDNRANRFYETIPNASVLDVRVVDRIDAETLEKLTGEEIAR